MRSPRPVSVECARGTRITVELPAKRDVERDCQECEGRGIVYVECLEHDEDGDYEECPACDGYRVEVKCPACGEWCSPSSRDPEGSDTVHTCQEDRT